MEIRHGWILQLFIWMLYCWQAHALARNWPEVSDNGFPGRNEQACDGFPIQLRCPANDVIKISSAMYGRQNRNQCSGSRAETEDTSCNLEEAKEIVANKCNNRSECTFHVSSKLFPDPCPGTKKYLEASFECVKYLFSCPGLLTGIGEEEIFNVDAFPQTGSWTKDPLSNPDHVFFAPSTDVVHEYLSWQDFVDGNPATTYDLQPPMARGNIVVYDRNLFYIKANSRNIVRYSLISMMRTKELALSGSERVTDADVTLAVDEYSLWVTYPSEDGFVKISSLDKEELTLSKTQTTGLRKSDSLRTFFICGVMYFVDPKSGDIGYVWDTMANKGDSNPSISFDKKRDFEFLLSSSSRRYAKRSFLRYNDSSISYNPRDRLLYLWDTEKANAVVYKLHFNNNKNGKSDTITGKVDPTRQQYRSTSLPQISIQADPERSKSFPPKVEHLPKTSCLPQKREYIYWPKTAAGDTAMMDCPDGTGEFATWQCEVTSPLQDPEWGVAGPDTSKCMTWAVDILAKYNANYMDCTFAFESLAAGVSRHEELITGKWLQVISKLMKTLLDDSALPSKQGAKRIMRCTTSIVSILFKRTEAWDELGKEQSTTHANELVTSLQRAAFIVADTVARSPAEYNDKDIFVVPNDMVLMQIEVRDKWLRYVMNQKSTSFPNEVTHKHTAGYSYGSDVMKVPNDAIMQQSGQGQFAIVFSLFRGIENHFSPRNDTRWKIDSSIISATLRHPLHKPAGTNRPISITLVHKEKTAAARRCAYWTYYESTKSGNWSSDGCTLEHSNSTHSTCKCYSLATYALLRRVQEGTLKLSSDVTLEVVVAVGILITVICLIACILTLSIFQNLQNGRTTILKHMSVCLLVAEVTFLVGVNQTRSRTVSAVLAGLFHYFIVAAFVWMALEGFQLYRMLCEVFESKSRVKWFYGIGYGVPTVIVGVSAALQHSDYGSGQNWFISPQSELIWSVITPISLSVLTKICLVCATLYKIRTQRLGFADSVKVSSVRLFMKEAVAVLFLVLATWILGMAWSNVRSTTLGSLFFVFSMFQGIVLVAFYCLLPRKVRQEYTKALEKVSCCGNQAKESYATNSMTFTKHLAPGRFIRSDTNASTQGQSRLQWEATMPKTVESFSFSPEVSAGIVENREQPPNGNLLRRNEPQNFTMNRSYEQRNGLQRHPEEEALLTHSRDVTNQDPIMASHVPLQYNRMHRHQHSDRSIDRSNFENGRISNQKKYRTGLPTAPRQQHRTHTIAQGRSTRTNPHFGRVPHSQSRDFADHRVPYPSMHSHANGPYYWDLDQPLLRAPCLAYPVAHRDFGVGSQNQPPASIVHHLRNDMQRQSVEMNGRFQPAWAGSDHVERRPAPLPIKIQTFTASPDSRRRELAYSEDEGQGSSFEDSENQNLCNRSNIAASRCARHDDMSISPSQSREKALAVGNAERRIKSVNSESEDPITTDCSGSSVSSFDQRFPRTSNQEMLV